MQQSLVLLWFPLPDLVVTTGAWSFYFQGSVLSVSFCRTWSGSLCIVLIALQEPQVDALMLYSMVSHLFGKVAALHLDDIIVKAYLCKQFGTASHSLLGWPPTC